MPLHLLCDVVSRVRLRIAGPAEESNVAIWGQFWALLRRGIKILISDGASGYRCAMDWVLRKARQQRCNILPAILFF